MVAVFSVTMFFSCKDNFKEVQKIGITQNEPISEARGINLKYTDSGEVKAHLVSPKMYDYSNRDFPFNEFPDGIKLTIFDDKGNENYIFSDYAVYYGRTKLIDLQGNVQLITNMNDTLLTDQIYYDEIRQWVFTNYPVTIISKGNVSEGNILDSDRNFKELQLMEGRADVYVNDNN
ncbi:LPS export ABC transporter periplasmic protein LptC [Aegicerativicinus sediminis]|uniref:LPS export ABC transporter periplasmic protein LptC n=1 Tax=Aegicerativicinus sediminis TaxID=2893202 RepID=UPI001E376DE7|nr:LPS export ABC transporter periplasmic protein LptC [Aegicerativicinus sediminis]